MTKLNAASVYWARGAGRPGAARRGAGPREQRGLSAARKTIMTTYRCDVDDESIFPYLQYESLK